MDKIKSLTVRPKNDDTFRDVMFAPICMVPSFHHALIKKEEGKDIIHKGKIHASTLGPTT